MKQEARIETGIKQYKGSWATSLLDLEVFLGGVNSGVTHRDLLQVFVHPVPPAIRMIA